MPGSHSLLSIALQLPHWVRIAEQAQSLNLDVTLRSSNFATISCIWMGPSAILVSLVFHRK